MTLKTTIYLSILIAIAITTWFIIQTILNNLWFVLIVAALVLAGVVWVGLNFGSIVHEHKLIARAQRQGAEWEAEKVKREAQKPYIIESSHGLHVEARHDTTWIPLHLEPGRANGVPQLASPDEHQRWVIKNSPSAKVVNEALGLPSGQVVQPPPKLDLLSIFTQTQQAYAIIAGQRVGKSFTGQRFANYWIQSGCVPVWIGPKLNQGEWTGCKIFGGQEDYQGVLAGLQTIEALARKRHASQERHESHPIQPVFLDDWTQTRIHLGEYAEGFILDATTLYASVNIVLYFMLHADTVNAWGVGKIGAALHQNFYKLYIRPGVGSSGMIDRSQNTGWLGMPGGTKKDLRQVALFSGVGAVPLLPDLILQPNEALQPTGLDAQIIEMIQAKIPRKDISEFAWGEGKYGKFYNDKIDKILAKYGIKT